MQVKVVCPTCNSESSMSLIQPTYQGPFRCWKCHNAFTLTLANGTVESCVPLSEEDFQKTQKKRPGF